MLFQFLSFSKQDHVGWLDVASPLREAEEVMALFDELGDRCAQISSDEDIRVLVIADTQHDDFYRGAAEPDFLLDMTEDMNLRWMARMDPVGDLELPVIAAIKGDAIGTGLELALACDMRIASSTSRFGLPEVRKGLIPHYGGTQRLSRLIGRGKSLEMILTGETIDAQEALRIGLVNQLAPEGELVLKTREIAAQMAAKAPIALRYAKEAICQGLELNLAQGLRLEADLYFLLHTTADRTEGITAFQEKRPPRFKGR